MIVSGAPEWTVRWISRDSRTSIRRRFHRLVRLSRLASSSSLMAVC